MRKICFIFVILILLSAASLAQNYLIDWYVIASGGGHSESGSYWVDGTIGQPIVGRTSSGSYIIEAGFWVGIGIPSCCDYVPGDINGDRNVMGNDVTYGVRYFKGIGPQPPDSCWNDSTESWLYSGGDANGNCSFSGSDITYLVAYFKGVQPEILYCPQTPPAEPPVLGIHRDVTPVGLPEE